jgi:hypothetical protein
MTMEMEVLKKKLSTYRTEGGYLKNVGDELLVEILAAWEQWSGPSRGFYRALGADHRKMASLMGRAKKLKRDGVIAEPSFKEVKVEASSSEVGSCPDPIVLKWEKNRVIRFSKVDQLVEFLKKAAA